MALLVGTNSYLSRADANAYLADRLHTGDWDAAADANKDKALVTAARLMDSMPWIGLVTNPDQAMAWPRVGVADEGGRTIPTDAVPVAVKHCQAELALHLLANDPNDPGTANQKRVKAGSVEVENFQRRPDRALPPVAYALVRQFLQATDSSVRLRP